MNNRFSRATSLQLTLNLLIMAKQAGIIKLKGTIEDIAFYKTADGHLARAKGGIDRNKLLHDPKFQRTRENNSEFGRAGRGGKLLRNAVRQQMINAKDRRVVSRLMTVLLAIIKTDPISPRGQRTIPNGNIQKLKGFDFNIEAPLSTAVYLEYAMDFDRVSGEATVNLDAFSPAIGIAAPSGTTHFKLNLGAAAIDFDEEEAVFAAADTGILPHTQTEVSASEMNVLLKPNLTLPVIQLFGVEFYQEVNGEFYPLKNGAKNALSIVKIDTV